MIDHVASQGVLLRASRFQPGLEKGGLFKYLAVGITEPENKQSSIVAKAKSVSHRMIH